MNLGKVISVNMYVCEDGAPGGGKFLLSTYIEHRTDMSRICELARQMGSVNGMSAFDEYTIICDPLSTKTYIWTVLFFSVFMLR